jgi:hypothetical protein
MVCLDVGLWARSSRELEVDSCWIPGMGLWDVLVLVLVLRDRCEVKIEGSRRGIVGLI